jgi:hypothetical protein
MVLSFDSLRIVRVYVNSVCSSSFFAYFMFELALFILPYAYPTELCLSAYIHAYIYTDTLLYITIKRIAEFCEDGRRFGTVLKAVKEDEAISV